MQRAAVRAGRAIERAELRRRQTLYGLTVEDMELILAPMVLDGKEAVGSMGDDTPLAVLSRHYRGLHHFFRQQFSQVTNPPIDPLARMAGDEPEDPLRQSRQRLRRGPEPDPDPAAREPGPDRDRARGGQGPFRRQPAHASTAPSTPAPTAGSAHALDRIRQEAEEAVRGGCETLILSDEGVGPDRVPIPMILAVGAVHSHLVRQGLRSFSYLIAGSGECLDTHYFAVLIGVGATAVNAYLAEAAIADRHARGLFPGLDAARPASPASRRRSTRACSR